RVVLHTNDVDFRARPVGADGEEADFLAALVANTTDWVAGAAEWTGNGTRSRAAFTAGAQTVSYADIEKAPAVVLVALEPEEECPILFLRLRKAVTKRRLRVHAVAPFTTLGLSKLDASLVRTAPGAEAGVLSEDADLRAALSQAGAILIIGERLA